MLNWSHLSRLWIGRMDGAGNGWIWALFWTIRPFISELCRRPAYLNKHDQERCDCRPRRQHLGLQLRIQRESFLPSFLSCQNLPLAKYSEQSNQLRGTVLIFDELTSPPWAPVTAFVMGEMWNRIRARVEFTGSSRVVGTSSEAGSQLRNLCLSWLLLRDASRNLLFSFLPCKIEHDISKIGDWYGLQSTSFVCRSVVFSLPQFLSFFGDHSIFN